MAKDKMVIDGSNNVSARQMKEFFRQMDEKLFRGPDLQNFLDKRKNLDVWKTIEIGKYQGNWEICPSLEQQGFTVDASAAKRIVNCLYLSTREPEKINLALVTMEDLGFSENDYDGLIPLADVFKQALKLGLTYCLPEDAPALREQYTDQPLMDYIRIGMVPVVDPHPMSISRCILVLNGKCMHCDDGERGVSMTDQFVFRICK